MEKTFSNLAQLRAEIGTLSLRADMQEEAIKEKFSSPVATFHTIRSLFKSKKGSKSILEELINHDIVTNITRLVLPIILNSSIFRGSGFITKSVVAFFSQKAAKNVNTDTLTHLIEKVKHFFNKKKEASRESVRDYGIPPDSETY